MTETATLTFRDQQVEIPAVVGSENEIGLDLGAAKLRDHSGLVTLDTGFKHTASTQSAITYLDGANGILRYRGYSIEDLADHCSFLEVCYLLLKGELPNAEELDEFRTTLNRHTLLHEDLRQFFKAFPKDAHPMGILSASMAALSTFYQDGDVNDPKAVELDVIRLLAKMPTVAGFAYKRSQGQPFIYPDNKLRYTANFMRMMFSFPTEDWIHDEDICDALDALLILHADHEQNCSTSTVRLVGSGHAPLYACISAGVAALWGSRHGGANQRVLNQLDQIHSEGGNVEKMVQKAKDKNDPFRLMGFGHRVYKNFDPRANILRKKANVVLEKLGIDDPLLDIAVRLEETALKDDYFIERKLFPNVDFYSGIIYRALGIPTDMMTVMFAMGRLSGWIAHWLEMHDQHQPIGRPRQIYTGPNLRQFVPIDQR
ncbi:MAG: citrate synthase [Myxococcota bacterium]|nr:citrate synthase [Myxococcota bacterium]